MNASGASRPFSTRPLARRRGQHHCQCLGGAPRALARTNPYDNRRIKLALAPVCSLRFSNYEHQGPTKAPGGQLGTHTNTHRTLNYTILYYTIPYHTIPYDTILYYTIRGLRGVGALLDPQHPPHLEQGGLRSGDGIPLRRGCARLPDCGDDGSGD